MLTVSKLRGVIYGLLRQGLESGTPIELPGTGNAVKIVPETPAPKLARLKKRKAFKGDPDEMLCMDWLKEWSEPR
jgi:hypothetical protein